MELETFLLADAAVVAEGKLFVLGGGISRLAAPSFPWLHPQLAVVLRMRLEPDEISLGRTVSLRMPGPDGSFAIPPAELRVPPGQSAELPDEVVFLQLALTIAPVPFQAPGTYQFEIAVDGHVIRTMALPVILAEGQ
jgi:hypothetical protein